LFIISQEPVNQVFVFDFLGVETFGKHAVVCGRSKNVGMPIAMLLHADGMGKYKKNWYCN
jgi:methylenetetrahydrofolate dehydrogenase(NAD+)/5,10-methenyltetrahydrofolate cyclohydrolase